MTPFVNGKCKYCKKQKMEKFSKEEIQEFADLKKQLFGSDKFVEFSKEQENGNAKKRYDTLLAKKMRIMDQRGFTQV